MTKGKDMTTKYKRAFNCIEEYDEIDLIEPNKEPALYRKIAFVCENIVVDKKEHDGKLKDILYIESNPVIIDLNKPNENTVFRFDENLFLSPLQKEFFEWINSFKNRNDVSDLLKTSIYLLIELPVFFCVYREEHYICNSKIQSVLRWHKRRIALKHYPLLEKLLVDSGIVTKYYDSSIEIKDFNRTFFLPDSFVKAIQIDGNGKEKIVNFSDYAAII